MKVNLRQGLILPNKADYLVRRATSVDLRIPRFVRIVFTHGPVNYLSDVSSDVVNAWPGSYSDSGQYWFYWEIDTETGRLTRGVTQIEPLNGRALPGSPVVDQHFFDKTDNYMKVWDGFNWIKKIRTFAGSLVNGVLLNFGTGSQADIYGDFQAYPIRFFKVGKPIRRELDDGNFIFLVDTGNPKQDVGQIENFRLKRVDNSATSAENIAKSKAVVFNADGELIAANYTNIDKEVLGVTEVAVGTGDKRNIVTRGFIEDRNLFNFSEAPLTPLFVGLNGNISTNIPSDSSIQKIGYVISQYVIFVDIEPQILILSTPTPTPTATATATVTPSVTATLTPTPGASLTP
jgi:hypothetical protein